MRAGGSHEGDHYLFGASGARAGGPGMRAGGSHEGDHCLFGASGARAGGPGLTR
jgi:hypothetical protein